MGNKNSRTNNNVDGDPGEKDVRLEVVIKDGASTSNYGQKDEYDDKLCDSSHEKEPSKLTSPVSYHLKLLCSTDETKSRNTKIVIPYTPRTVLDIKLCVEKEFSIPVCCQRITFESHELRDQDSIEQLRIREGDTLTIAYTSDAMVEDIRGIIEAMKAMTCFLRQNTTRKQLDKGCLQDGKFSNDIDGKSVEQLASTYFHPSDEERSKTNCFFFVSNNGIQIMQQLHEELLSHPWKNCLLEMQYLEHGILTVLWKISASFPMGTLPFLLQKPTLEAVMKSLVRVKIPAHSLIQGPRKGSYQSQAVTSETLFKAVGTLGNLAEIPEYREAIASRRVVLDQLLATMTCPSYSFIYSLVASASLLCLAYSSETHPYLITNNVIEKLEKVCETRKHNSTLDRQLLCYFQSVFYAQLLNASASKIPLHLKKSMHKVIRNFLAGASHVVIHTQEKKRGYFWTTVIPFARLAYFPKHTPQWSFCSSENSDEDSKFLSDENTKFLKDLEELCIEIGVFSLQNIFLSEQNREILIVESVIDYIVCLPWHLSSDTMAHSRACDLRNFLSHNMQLKPPSLVNLTKAKLAVTSCGLDKVLKATSLHDIVNSIS